MAFTTKEKIDLLGKVRQGDKGLSKLSRYVSSIPNASKEEVIFFLIERMHHEVNEMQISNFGLKIYYAILTLLDSFWNSIRSLSSREMESIRTVLEVQQKYQLDNSVQHSCPLVSCMTLEEILLELEKRVILEEEAPSTTPLSSDEDLRKQNRKLLKENAQLLRQIKDLRKDVIKEQKNRHKKEMLLHSAKDRNRVLRKEKKEILSKYTSQEEIFVKYQQQQFLLSSYEKELALWKNVKPGISSYLCLSSLEEAILRLLYQRSYTLEELTCLLQDQSYYVTPKEVYASLISLNRQIGINGLQANHIPVSYRVKKDVLTNQSFDLEWKGHKKPLEMVLYSDIHFYEGHVQSSFSEIDLLNEYCVSKNIPYLFHLGDLISRVNYLPFDYDLMLRTRDFFREIIQKMPHSPTIFYGFLGGNHDEDFLRSGMDINTLLSEEHANFFSLGYYHAFLHMGSRKNMIGLHHPTCRIQVEDGEEVLNTYLKQVYNSQNPRNTVMDFLGHNHRGYFSSQYGVALVPSLTRDRFENGAWHLKIYFNSGGEILDIHLIPLSLERQVLVHQEKLFSNARAKRK